jgi:hypothetical protein
VLTGSTSKGKDHVSAAKELKQPLAGDQKRPQPKKRSVSCFPRRARWSTASRW